MRNWAGGTERQKAGEYEQEHISINGEFKHVYILCISRSFSKPWQDGLHYSPAKWHLRDLYPHQRALNTLELRTLGWKCSKPTDESFLHDAQKQDKITLRETRVNLQAHSSRQSSRWGVCESSIVSPYNITRFFSEGTLVWFHKPITVLAEPSQDCPI